MSRPMRADARRNREQLLEVASDAFSEYGVDASLEEIARRAGVGIGTLYRHFPSRDALLEAVFRRNIDQLADSADELLRELPPDRALDEWMRAVRRTTSRARRAWPTHLKTVLSADSPLFVYTHERMNASIRGLVLAAAAAGSIREDVDPAICCGPSSGVCLMADEPGWQEQACRICSLLMDGLRYQTEPVGR